MDCAAPRERCFDYGDAPGAANVAKLCGNFLIAASIEALGESLALAEGHGVDREAVLDCVEINRWFGTSRPNFEIL